MTAKEQNQVARVLATIGLVFALTVLVGALVCGVICWLTEGMVR
jgi:hypothetical protein